MKVSILIPYIRPDNIPPLIERIEETVGIPKSDYEILTKEDRKRIGCPKTLKKLVKKSVFECVAFIGDDTWPSPDFIKNALLSMAKFPDGWGLVGLNDLTGRVLPTHWVGHKKLLPFIGGEFFHTGYHHCFCDNELALRSIKIKRFKYDETAIVEHKHPMLGYPQNMDADYAEVYSTPVMSKDQELFNKRLKNEWRS